MHDRTAGCADGAKAEVDATKVVMMREVVNFMGYYLLWLCWVVLCVIGFCFWESSSFIMSVRASVARKIQIFI